MDRLNQPERRPRRSSATEAIQTVLIAVILALVIRGFVFEPYVVEGYSMEPTLWNGEHVLIDKLGWHLTGLHYGEIVVFHPPLPTNQDFIKRVIATAGQTVSMTNGVVFVNGHKMPEPFLLHDGTSYQDHFNLAPEKVLPGHIFVLGDHRAASEDSRFFGQVPVGQVDGVAFFILWPFSDFGAVPRA